MNNFNTEHQKNLTILSIKEVASKIKYNDDDAARNWLTSNNIEIHKRGRQNYVYQIDVDCAIDKPYVESLIKKYPKNWEEVYRNISNDSAVSYLVILQLKSIVPNIPQTKVRPTSDAEINLLKRLSK